MKSLTQLLKNYLKEISKDFKFLAFITFLLTILFGTFTLCGTKSLVDYIQESESILIPEDNKNDLQIIKSLDDNSNLTLQHNKSKQILYIEIASTPSKRFQGYQNRETIPSNEAMLFIFENEDYRSFWMKNTFVSLDIIFLNKNFEVINFHKNTKTNQISEVYPSEMPAQYVLETPNGFIDKVNLITGDTFSIIDYKL